MIKRKKVTHTMTAASAALSMRLAATMAKILKIEIKGDDADVDSNTTFAIHDADGRRVMAAKAVDAGTDDSTVKATNQDYSTVGVGFYLAANEADMVGVDGVAQTDNQGSAPGVIARSPLAIDLAAGTSGDAFEITIVYEI